MARKRKNKIVEEQAVSSINAQSPAEQTAANDALAPVVSNESLVEDIPDSAEQMSKLEEQLTEMSRMQAQLNAARQRIDELESEVKRLQSDNDMLVMKLAENAAAQASIPLPPTAADSSKLAMKADEQLLMMHTQQKPISKRVQYRYPNYGNNGYGTWH